MYTFEERMKAVELYIQSGCSEGTVIRTLGYPSHTALRNWYKEYLAMGSLRKGSAPKPRYTQEKKVAAVEYYSMTSPAIRLLYSSAIAYPLANSVMKSLCSIRATWFSSVATINWLQRRTASTTNCGTPRRSIIRSLRKKRFLPGL